MNYKKTAPICLFVYNRLAHTERTVLALKTNSLAQESDLIVFSDAPKSEAQIKKVKEVRQFIKKIDGFKSVTIIERNVNLGLARSIIDGVTTTLNKYGRVIVLEDDLLTSPNFLTYMNEALDKYENDDRVASIHGYVFPVHQSVPETFFLPGADCWGWATWSRGWACFNPDGRFLLSELNRKNLNHSFDFNGAYPFVKMLEGQIKGENDSWAIRWYASAFLADKLTLYPGRSLVQNIGFDNSGTHCDSSKIYDVELSNTPIKLSDIEIQTSQECRDAFADYFRRIQPKKAGILIRLIRKVRYLLKIERK